jgi:hypothetical protein
MEESKNLEQNSDNSNEKLHISDVRQRLIDRIDELKKDKRIMFGDENYVYKAPMGRLNGIHPKTSEFYLYVYDRLIKELEDILNVV